jgi:hypothetical protein
VAFGPRAAGGLATESDHVNVILAEGSDFDWTIRAFGLDERPPPSRLVVRGCDSERQRERPLARHPGAFRRLRTRCCAFQNAFSCVCVFIKSFVFISVNL